MGDAGSARPPLSPPSGMKTEITGGIRWGRQVRLPTALQICERERGKKTGNKIGWNRRDPRTGHSQDRGPGGRTIQPKPRERPPALLCHRPACLCRPDLVLSPLPPSPAPSAHWAPLCLGVQVPNTHPKPFGRLLSRPASQGRLGLPHELLNRIFYKYTTYKNC